MTDDRRTRPFLTAGVTVLPADEVVPVLLHLAGGLTGGRRGEPVCGSKYESVRILRQRYLQR